MSKEKDSKPDPGTGNPQTDPGEKPAKGTKVDDSNPQTDPGEADKADKGKKK